MNEYDKNFWIDLDVLVHEDVTELITRKHHNITFIWNYWNDYEEISLFNYGQRSVLSYKFIICCVG